MTDKLTHESLAKLLGDKFTLAAPDARIEFELIECTKTPTQQPVSDGMREPFSLVFRGPSDPVFDQQIIPLEHESLGRVDLFVVPIGPDQEGMRYEAVFT